MVIKIKLLLKDVFGIMITVHFTVQFQKPMAFICSVCYKAFSLRPSLQDHIRGTHGLGNPFCCRCGMKFTSRRGLGRHKKTCELIKIQIDPSSKNQMFETDSNTFSISECNEIM